MCNAQVVAIPGLEVDGLFANDLAPLGSTNFGFNPGYNRICDSILNVEDFVEIAVTALSPKSFDAYSFLPGWLHPR